MMLLNTYDLGNYIQHFHALQESGRVPRECYMFLIRQFFTDESCNDLVMTMISTNGTTAPYRIVIKNDENWTTTVLMDYAGVTEVENKHIGMWMRVWDHAQKSMTDLTRVWALLSFGQFH